jgi:hypothetical protein
MNSNVVPTRPLKVEFDPFAVNSAIYLGAPLRVAIEEIVHLAVSQTPVIAVTGAASTGKTLLAGLTARACCEKDLSVRHVERPDLAGASLDARVDVLLFDEADAIANSMLEQLLAKDGGCATTTIFFGLPALSLRLAHAGAHPVRVDLAPFSREDSRNYLLALAAASHMPQIFEPEALDQIVDRVGSSPRLLRSTASLAYFFAASAGASKICVKYAASALGTRMAEGFPEFARERLAPKFASESPVALAPSKPVAAAPADAEEALKPDPPNVASRTVDPVETGELTSDDENASAWQLPRVPQHALIKTPTGPHDMLDDGAGRPRARTVIAGSLIVVAAVLGSFFPTILRQLGPGAASVLLNEPARIETSGANTVPAPVYNAAPASGAAPSAAPDDVPAPRSDNVGTEDRSGSETVFANPAPPAPPDVTPAVPTEPTPSPPAATPPSQAAAAPERVAPNSSGRPAIDQTLTAEEREAVARGLRELERDRLR